jgi:hypothetical protein
VADHHFHCYVTINWVLIHHFQVQYQVSSFLMSSWRTKFHLISPQVTMVFIPKLYQSLPPYVISNTLWKPRVKSARSARSKNAIWVLVGGYLIWGDRITHGYRWFKLFDSHLSGLTPKFFTFIKKLNIIISVEKWWF